MIQKNYIAIDVSKKSLQVATSTHNISLGYTLAGLNKLISIAQKYENPLIVCEATGGYERDLMVCMYEHSIPVARITPSRIKAFNKSDGLKAKTDKIDAAQILRFAQSKEVEATAMPSETVQMFQALMDRRSHLSEMIAREKNREQMSSKYSRASIIKVIRILETELKSIESEIEELICSDNELSQKRETMIQVRGVGKITAWSILAYLSEITELNRNQISALAGVCPYNKDTGVYRGKRRIEGGRAKVRSCLFMAAKTASIHNPQIKVYFEGLRERGKPYKCAMVAAMRKLLLHIQSLLKNPKKCIA